MEQSNRPPDDESSVGGQGNELEPGSAPETPREMPFFRPAPFPAAAPETPQPTTEVVATGAVPEVIAPVPASTPAPPAVAGSGDGGGNDWSVGKTLRHAVAAIGRNWAVAIPVALFAIAMLVVPTMTKVTTAGDAPFARAVGTLYHDRTLAAPVQSTLTAIGQIAWGDLFARIFGFNPGVLRLSTTVAVAIGAVAFYAILRMLGVNRHRSVLGTCLLLFNPLSFVLAFTFMPDPHLTAWMLVALACYAKGLDDRHPRGWVIVLGSLAAGFAFLVSQQGALIPMAILCFLIATRRLWFDVAGLQRIMQVAGIPVLTVVGYAIWVRWFSDGPDQENVFRGIGDAGWRAAWSETRYLIFFVVMYVGLLLLPLLVAVAPGWRGQRDETASFRTPVGYWLFLGVTGVIVTGLFFLTNQDRTMPYLAGFVGLDGFGSADVPGGRPPLVTWASMPQLLTIVAALGAIVAGLLICRHLVPEPSPQRAVAGIVVMVGCWQLAGILVRVFAEGRGDQLLLPLIPLGIALLLWALRDVRMVEVVGWVVLAVVAAGSVAGTRDTLETMGAAWSLAGKAESAGVASRNVDAGVAWNAYHAGDPGIGTADLQVVVTTDPAAYPDFVVVEEHTVDSWLGDPTTLVLMRRGDVSWPGRSDGEPSAPVAPLATPEATPGPSPVASPVVSPVAVTPTPSPAVSTTPTATPMPSVTATPSPTPHASPTPAPLPTKPSGGDDLPVLAVGN